MYKLICGFWCSVFLEMEYHLVAQDSLQQCRSGWLLFVTTAKVSGMEYCHYRYHHIGFILCIYCYV